LVRGIIVNDLEREVETLSDLRSHTHTDQTTRFVDKKCYRFCGHCLRGKHNVPFVLTGSIVENDHAASRSEIREYLFKGS
jgi:hypothetical protein